MFADAGLVSQVFQNLLGNAFKYATRRRVVASAQKADGTVTCVAHDNGADIPLDMQAKVFDKLAIDPDNTGTGLGLASVKRVSEGRMPTTLLSCIKPGRSTMTEHYST